MSNLLKAESLVKSSFWNFMMIFFGKIGGFTFVILLARFLLPEKFGIYSLAIYITLFFVMFADTGINQTILKFFSEGLKKNSKDALPVYKYLLKFKIILVVSLTTILIILSYPISIFFNKSELFVPLLISSFYIFVLSLESFFISFFYIFEEVKYLAKRQVIWEMFRIITLIITFNLISKEHYVVAAILVLIGSTLISFLFLLRSIKKIFPDLFQKKIPILQKNEKRKIKRFLFRTGFLSALNLIFLYIDTFILGVFVSAEFVGYYAAVWAIISGFSSFFILSTILLPAFSQSKKENTNSSISKIFRYIFIFSIPIIFGIILLGNYLIRLFYGYEYLPAVWPFLILSLIIFESPLTGILNSLFLANERQSYLSKVITLAIFINLALSLIFIPLVISISFSAVLIVVSCVVVFSRILYLALVSNYARKNLNISLGFKNISKPLICALCMFILLYLLNSYLIKEMNLIAGLLEIFLGGVIYFLLMFLIKGLTKKDVLFFMRIKIL